MRDSRSKPRPRKEWYGAECVKAVEDRSEQVNNAGNMHQKIHKDARSQKRKRSFK